MTRSTVVTPPPAEVTRPEPVAILAAFKSSLAKRWSYTRMETLYEIADLVAFLHALDRDAEAIAVAHDVAAHIPCLPPWPGGGYNYNVWSPATQCHAFLVHVDPPALAAQVAASRQALLEDPGILRENTDYIAASIAKAVDEAAIAPAAKPTKWDRQHAARHFGTALLYRVLAEAGDAAFVPHAEAAKQAMTGLWNKLRQWLATGR